MDHGQLGHPSVNSPWFSIPFVSDGDPMIVIPRTTLSTWRGSEYITGSDERYEPHDPRSHTHYSMACTAEDWISVLSFDGEQVVVIGAGIQIDWVRWLSVPTIPWTFLIAWVENRDIDAVLPRLNSINDMHWRHTDGEIRSECDEMILMHAADVGSKITEVPADAHGIAEFGEGIPYRIGHGRYRLEVAEVVAVVDGQSTHYPVCRFRPADWP
jgi:hypothetical protein